MRKLSLLVIAVLLSVVTSCVAPEDRQQPQQQRQIFTYTVVDKKEAVESHYNLMTDKQVIGTKYYLILKDASGIIYTEDVSLKEFYQYEKGSTYRTYYRAH